MKSSAVVAAAMGLLLLAACDRGESAPEQEAAQDDEPSAASSTERPVADVLSREFAGKPAPDIAFTAKDGSEVRLSDFAGKPVLVNLWATWCLPCIVEMPALDRSAATLGEDAIVLPISQDLEGWTAITPFWDKGGYSAMTPYWDETNAWLVAYPEAANLPTTILFDADGKEVWRVTGPADWAGKDVADLVRSEG